MNQGNTKLVDYGIQNWESDYMIHVCVASKHIYVYPTSSGQKAIKKGCFRLVSVWTGNIETAKGYLVPPRSISGCVWFKIPLRILRASGIGHKGLTTSEKGHKAESIVKHMLGQGLIVLPAQAEVVRAVDDQIRGLDGRISSNPTYQVKCDYKGGHSEFGGTGNLFLQIQECNPNQMR